MLLLLAACADASGDLTVGPLPPCPASPNCVTSEAGADEVHRTDPLPLAEVDVLRDAVEGLPRCRVEAVAPDALHATCRTMLLRFVDDLDLRVDREAGVTQVRSASRLGYGDLGVNARRVRRLREALATRPPD